MTDRDSESEQQSPTLLPTAEVQRKRPFLGKGLPPLLGSLRPTRVRTRQGPSPLEVVRMKRAMHERLRSARIALGMDHTVMATKLGVTTLQYGLYEEHIWPPHHLIPGLCQILEICAGELYGTHR
jgi:hypothetical protein